MISSEPQVASPERRKFNFFLAIGIAFLPFIFVWFLLRKGHSTTGRIVGFGWLALFLLAGASSRLAPSSPTNSTPNSQTGDTDPSVELSDADRAAVATQVEQERAETRLRQIRRAPENFLVLERENGVRGGFDTVFMLSGRIRNTSEVDIKDPEISCVLFGPSGTQVGRVRETLFEVVPAQSTQAFAELNMGFMGSTQVDTHQCEIVDGEAIP